MQSSRGTITSAHGGGRCAGAARGLVLIALLTAAFNSPATRASDSVPATRVAHFSADVTPPLGSPLCGGWIKPLAAVDDPLLGKGVLIEQGAERFVLCALDWCEARNGAYDALRDALARAADCPARHVAVQCLHQHNAPLVDTDAQRLLDAAQSGLSLMDVEAFDAAVAALASAVASARQAMVSCDRLAIGQARVDRVASSRRVKASDGHILVRYSSTTDATLQAAPEGDIDPVLRTISFLQGERPLVRLHYYATHPQSFYGDGRGTSDIPGLARARLEAEERIPHIYFTGCAGDVTAGKYNNGSPAARVELTERLADGMRAAIVASQPTPISKISVRAVPLALPLREDAGWAESEARQALGNRAAPAQQRLNAALALAFRARRSQPIELTALACGEVQIVHLPGEPFVTFQQQAQGARPECFVAVAGYGDGSPGYLCTERSFAEGGYEPTATLVDPRGERVLREAIARLLNDDSSNDVTAEP